MTETTVPRMLRAVFADADAGATVIGYLELVRSKLVVLAAEKGCEARLERLVQYVNRKDSILVEAQPPAGARPHAVYSRKVHASDPKYFDAIAEVALKYHDVTLERVEVADLPPGVAPQEDYRDDDYRERAFVPPIPPPAPFAPPAPEPPPPELARTDPDDSRA